jgi:hypothetical protein
VAGYRRVTAELHGEGRIVNHKKVIKKVMRLMKENGLSVRPRAALGRSARNARRRDAGRLRKVF